MQITCPTCNYSRDVGEIRLPHGNVLVKCPTCSAEFYIGSHDSPPNTSPPISSCPKCNTLLPLDQLNDTCAHCGLIISKYLQRQARAARPALEEFAASPQQVCSSQSSSRNKLIGIIIAVLLCLVAILNYDWELDKDYVLLPGVWQGEMTYLGKKHPFVLKLETVQSGTLNGKMEWVGYMPSYVLAIEGTYNGNHLVFEDHAFITNNGDHGLHDKKNVYIIDDEMNGTDKNGRALLHAVRRAATPDFEQQSKN